MQHRIIPALAAMSFLASAPASAGEAFVGIFAHNVDLPTTIGSPEGGVDIQFGVRSRPLGTAFGAGELRAYAFGSVNDGSGLDFAAAGAALRLPVGAAFYVQPALGLAVHNGPGGRFSRGSDRLYLGSRVVFAPEIALGWQTGDRVAIEAGFVHLSHARLGSGQNPGMDDLGIRLVYRFGR
jgi:hypothetical protein